MMGLFSYLIAPYMVKPGNQLYVSIIGFVVMFILVKLAKKHQWLKEWGLGFAILIGTVAGIMIG
jgi:uncharacterized membrane protein